jgi:uncharacterized membrane protein
MHQVDEGKRSLKHTVVAEYVMNVKARLSRYWKSFSFVGLVFATLFFAASVTPSLVPRNYFFQGLLCGLALTIGYGHSYSPSSYIDAWIAVTQPKNWSAEKTARLKQLFSIPSNENP